MGHVGGAARPPENVVAVMADGAQVPVECDYVGQVDGHDEWRVRWERPEVPTRLMVGVLPARSQLRLVVRPR